MQTVRVLRCLISQVLWNTENGSAGSVEETNVSLKMDSNHVANLSALSTVEIVNVKLSKLGNYEVIECGCN